MKSSRCCCMKYSTEVFMMCRKLKNHSRVPVWSNLIQYRYCFITAHVYIQLSHICGLLKPTQHLIILCEFTVCTAVLDRGFVGRDHGKPWIQHCRFIESRAAHEGWPASRVIVMLGPTERRLQPWVGVRLLLHLPRCGEAQVLFQKPQWKQSRWASAKSGFLLAVRAESARFKRCGENSPNFPVPV